jgi:hypothetical protein
MSTKPFDPFTATLEEAQAQPDAYAVHGPVWRFYGAQNLLDRRAYFEANILEGVAICMLHDLIAPRWLAVRFLRAQREVKWALLQTWDDAFGRPHPAGKRLSTLRLKYFFGHRVEALFTGHAKLPRTLAGRQEAARQLGISEKQVRALLPKTRVNVRGHKPYTAATTNTETPPAHDPFHLTRKKVPGS